MNIHLIVQRITKIINNPIRTDWSAVVVETRRDRGCWNLLNWRTFSYRKRSDTVAVCRVTRATATGGWWSPRAQPLPTLPSIGSLRIRHRRISATIYRTNWSFSGSEIVVVVLRNSAANVRPESRNARDQCDRVALLRGEKEKFSTRYFWHRFFIIHRCRSQDTWHELFSIRPP